MYDVTDLHIELTDKCQASCPMCARNYNGGAERPFVGQHEITIGTFKQWFDPSWLVRLKNFYACGNYGDPIIARDCFEIFDYVRKYNSQTRLAINTNGSARTIGWWQQLAALNIEVTFGIDGFEISHNLYRRGTDWNKIIQNLTAFVQAGGKANVDCLVFAHNQSEVKEFESFIKSLGVDKVNFKYTGRFYNLESYPVQDVKGNVEYRIFPSSIKKSSIDVDYITLNKEIWTKTIDINPKCVSKQEIYVDARGNVFPCCWVGSDWVEQNITETGELQILRNQMIEDTKSKFQNVGITNLHSTKIQDIQWSNISSLWSTDHKPWVCAKNCNE